MHDNIGVTSDRRREVRVQRRVQRIVAVLGDIEHAGAEVLRGVHGLVRDDLKQLASGLVFDSVEAFHEGTS